MVGFDDRVTVMEDWMMPSSPSPRTIFSSMTSDDLVESGSEYINRSLFSGQERQSLFGNADQNNQNRASTEGNEASVIKEPKANARGGLLERRAGFNASKLKTESIRPPDLSKNLEVRSPAFVVPPGLSPTSFLLESPVFLSNSLVLPSPTTGQFLFAPTGNNGNSALMTDDSDKGKEITREVVNDSSFAFKPAAKSSPFTYFNAVNKVTPSDFAPQSFSSVAFSVASNIPVLNQSLEPHSQNNGAVFQQTNCSGSHVNKGSTQNSDISPPLDESHEDDRDQRSSVDPNIGNGPAEDGYNWRKYGQKQVKGSEYPRSYYKCTHPNCPVKKKVERSHEGHITEIIYKGAHNHLKPPPNRRSAIGLSSGLGELQLDSEQLGTEANGGLTWSNLQKGTVEYDNGAAATLHGQSGVKYESVDGGDGSPAFSNDVDDEDCATHGSATLGYDGEGDESESKKRKVETYASDLTGASRAIREPRVVVQTTSEVDILDDGYRWRKYGQKVVKGNPNPRSYYKCTSAGCNVRKHVERACHDLKSVITTYEGKHNHDVPAARNSNHMNSVGSAFPKQQPPPSSHIHRPEPSQVSSLGSFGFQGRITPSFGYGMNQPGPAGLGMARLGPNQVKLPSLSTNQFLGYPGRNMNNDMAFMVPKDEPKLDSGSNPPPSNQALLYQQFMNRLPLGPQM